MKLFDKPLAVEEAKSKLCSEIAYNVGWKLSKSQNKIKKTIDDLVFKINFSFSKWNNSYKNIEVYCECSLWSKKFDKELNVRSVILHYTFSPNKGYYWNITTQKNLEKAIKLLSEEINERVIPLSNQFEADFSSAIKKLAEVETFDLYNVAIDFIDIYAGREYAKNVARHYYDSLSDSIKNSVINYKNGANDLSWMINRSNLKYIVDNNVIEL